MGAEVTVTSFAVIVIGSLGHPLGTVLGGIVYGISYMFMQSYYSSWANLLPYVLLIAILLCDPAACSDGGCAVPKIVRQLVANPCLPVVGAFALLPSVYGNQLLLFNFMIFMTLAQGINVIYGFTGYLPFGYVGFFGAGAYGFSLMVIHLHAPPLLALPVGGGAAVALALLLTPLFRLSGASFSIANLAAALAVFQVISNPNLESITKGPYGISLSGVFEPTLAYGTALGVLAATIGLVIYLRNSHFGMALKAIREDPISASMAGINVVRERISPGC